MPASVSAKLQAQARRSACHAASCHAVDIVSDRCSRSLEGHMPSTTSGLTGAAHHVAMLLALCSSWLRHHMLHMSSHHMQLLTYMALSTMAPQPEEMVSSSGSTCSPCRQSSQWAGWWSCQDNSRCSQRQISPLPCSTCRHTLQIGQTQGDFGNFIKATDAAANGRAAFAVQLLSSQWAQC